MSRYPDDLTLRQARQLYFEANGFGQGGYEASWVKLQAGPVAIYLPNTAARVRAVKLHDLHHAATEYDTTWTGEAEIAAWEIASSCAHHYAAWILNLQAWAIGLAIAPRAVFRAFVRGCSNLNLYRTTLDDELLDRRLGSLRRELRIDDPPGRPAATQRALFALWSIAAVATLTMSGLLLLLPVVLLVKLLT